MSDDGAAEWVRACDRTAVRPFAANPRGVDTKGRAVFVEKAWVGRTLSIADGVRLEVAVRALTA